MRKYTLLLALILCALLLTNCTTAPEVSGPVVSANTTSWFVESQGEGALWLAPGMLQELGVDPQLSAAPQLHFSWGAEELPWFPLETDAGWGAFLFAPDRATRYTERTAIRLEVGAAGTRLEPQAVPATLSPAPALVTQHWEQEERYLPQATAELPWFWQPIYAPGQFTQTVVLTDLQPGPITATLQLWSHTAFSSSPDHRARLKWDGQLIEEWEWDGRGMQRLTAHWEEPAPTDEHSLVLETPTLTEGQIPIVWLDSVELSYQQAVSGGIYTATGSALSVPDGALALDLTAPSQPLLLAAVDGAIASVPGHRYWIGEPQSARAPLTIRPAQPLALDELAELDYLALSPAEFQPALQPLLDARAAQEMKTAVVAPQAVYDTLGQGRPAPEAIQALVQELPALRYLLLVGDATVAPGGYDGESGALRVVTAFTRTTILGETAADGLFGRDAAGTPTVSVGRFPAETRSEVETMVAKTIAWEENVAPPQPLLLHDDEAQFKSLVTDLASLIPGTENLLPLDAGAPDCREQALASLAQGPSWLTYNGHGSLRQLGDEGVLSVDDGAQWSDPALVVAWSCLAAHYTHTQQPAMAETWLRQAEGGAVAFLGPVGETTTSEQRPFAQAFYRALNGTSRLGDAWLAALQIPGADDVRWGFTLLGDPALRVRNE